MKIVNILFVAMLFISIAPLTAQTADEIINNYFEQTGGMDAWGKVDGILISGNISVQGMDIPVDVYRGKDGKQLVKINYMGQDITQVAFDGETMWTTNMMTMQPEKSDEKAIAMMKEQAGNDFPSPFYNYKKKGFTVDLIGKDTLNGQEAYKVKLTQKPIMIDDKEVPTESYYYFDTKTFVPIGSETEIQKGPMKGQMSTNAMGDYQQVGDLYFPFDLEMAGQNLIVTEVKINPKMSPEMFAFPE